MSPPEKRTGPGWHPGTGGRDNENNPENKTSDLDRQVLDFNDYDRIIEPDEPTDDELLTEWEQGFLASIDVWEGELTPRQQEKLDEIEMALEERREAWRQARFNR
jgi:hypothetical protein